MRMAVGATRITSGNCATSFRAMGPGGGSSARTGWSALHQQQVSSNQGVISVSGGGLGVYSTRNVQTARPPGTPASHGQSLADGRWWHRAARPKSPRQGHRQCPCQAGRQSDGDPARRARPRTRPSSFAGAFDCGAGWPRPMGSSSLPASVGSRAAAIADQQVLPQLHLE